MSVFPWQQSHWQHLNTSRQAGRLPHALLFTGVEGAGLRQFAEAFARKLLCEQEGSEYACHRCRACALTRSGSHPDLSLVEPEAAGKQLTVDLIRDMLQFVFLKSHAGRYKIAIIDQADAMNRFAANALLKTLEEPPPQSLIILIAHQPSRLPITIRSRCQTLDFTVQHSAEVIDWTRNHIENQSIDAETVLAITGSPLSAVELANGDGFEQREQVIQDLELCFDNRQSLLTTAKRWSDIEPTQLIAMLQGLFHDMLKLKIADNPPALRNIDVTERLRRLINQLDLHQILSCSQVLATMYSQINSTVSYNTQALIEGFLYNWQSAKTGRGVEH